MKLVIALIQPHRLEAIREELNKREIFRLTVLDASGYGRQRGQLQYFRGQELDTNLIDKIELQIAVNDNFVKPTIEAIIAGAREKEKGALGDGKIFVLPLEKVIRISDGTEGKKAI
ncbi:MAG: P-II family nitrogen regulator [Spirochaetia bacterium]|nr:P-II family nitrogen regulator [Spirochaetia bacterium]